MGLEANQKTSAVGDKTDAPVQLAKLASSLSTLRTCGAGAITGGVPGRKSVRVGEFTGELPTNG